MGNKRQHTQPIIIRDVDGHGQANILDRIPLASKNDQDTPNLYDEGWLQALIFEHPSLLPIDEIEPAFFPLYPVCRELPTEAGFLDNLYVSENGSLTLVECKLWRNPQARREVVGQVLDYAKDLSQWSYEDLDDAVKSATGDKINPLFEAVASQVEELDEARFVDSVTRNLKRGQFLLLIVGDGIREGVENIANFLQAHAGLDFTFGLIEVSLFRLPDDQGLLVQPRVVAQTYNVERAVVKLEAGQLIMSEPEEKQVTHKKTGRRTTISEEQFFESLAESTPGIADELRAFLDEAAKLEISSAFGSRSLILRWFPTPDLKMNFGTIKTDGLVNTDPVNWVPMHLNRTDIGYEYLDSLANIVPGTMVKRNEKGIAKWLVLAGSEPPISELLKVKDAWLEVIQRAQAKLTDAVS